MFHGLNTNQRCKSDFLAFKTDISKAYGRVEWLFLEAVLCRLGFDDKWTSWIMWCVSSVSYQVLLNGQPPGSIVSEQSFRQGDPLSSYLVILCPEVLLANIKKAKREEKMIVSSFVRQRRLNVKNVMEIIDHYGKASGQEDNLAKSSILFRKKVPGQVREQQLKTVIRISKEGEMGSYLGIPKNLQASRNKAFSYVRDRLDDRMNGWSDLTFKLTSAISNFWWSSNDKDRGLHWVAWDKLCDEINNGGLGFRALDKFNDVMLAKQYWQLIQFSNSLFARVLQGRYFWNKHPLLAKKPHSPSFDWKIIYSTKDLVMQGARWLVGTGTNISVWRDPWIPDQYPRPANGRDRNITGFQGTQLEPYEVINQAASDKLFWEDAQSPVVVATGTSDPLDLVAPLVPPV
ncbi:PREDICTED: uncharacterized protein LOC104734010 [Camelina sativa]|uniref:Uncharacterized protein LOC104734010 n=1 Tax=Camelina sativa TaxID=90675 RepID=A0ABM0V6V1_CAMSA|nr:PREDICTED: uncharacterized protein LOC104734010 [Camelina sativa]